MITRRLASTAASSSSSSVNLNKPRTIVLIGAGFLGSYIARALVADPRNRVRLVSRHPQASTSPSLYPSKELKEVYDRLSHLGSQILPPHAADITNRDTTELHKAIEGASAVVSMVGVLVGSPQKMKEVQQDGAERVAELAKKEGVGRVVMLSAIGADRGGVTPYFRTKAAAEDAFLAANPTSTIIRPSIVFGPGDSFFNRFATLAKWLPFLPVFGGGTIRFQPVYAGDVARAVEICCRDDPKVVEQVGGKIIEAGGPEVFTYRQVMELVLQYTGLRRLVISLPYWLGMIQAFVLEKLPESIFTLTRDQIKQLKLDNIVSPIPPLNSVSFEKLLQAFPSSLPSSSPHQAGLTSVHQVLPRYLSPQKVTESGKRTHGRGSAGEAEFDAVQKESRETKR